MAISKAAVGKIVNGTATVSQTPAVPVASSGKTVTANPSGSAGSTGTSVGAGNAGPGAAVPGGIPVNGLKGLRAKLSAMAQGWSTVFPSDSSLPTADGGIKQADVMTQLSAWLALYPAVDNTKVGYKAAVNDLHAAQPAMRAEISALTLALRGYFGPKSPLLAKFGIPAPKPRAKLTPAKAVVRAALSKETRTIRNTLSPKKKAGMKSQSILVAQVVPADSAASAPASAGASAAASSPAPAGGKAPAGG